MVQSDFVLTSKEQPHPARTRAILKAHPEARRLIGTNPWTFVILLGVLIMQWSIAYLVKDSPWWVILILAYTVGAFAGHALFVIIHEACHDLVFKKRWANRLTAILADTGHLIPTAISFGLYHQKHHTYMGNYEKDADLAYRTEARLIGSSFFKKALWLFLFPIVEGVRSFRIKGMTFFTGWTVANWLIVFAFDGALVYFAGVESALYLFLSLLFGIGLHPVGARWIQEHYLVAAPQETYSYYGPVNRINMNIGYHNEHHDIPSIPWNKLPELKKMAPEWYDNLYSHKSYAKLLWRFLTDKNLTLFSRIVRD